MTVKANSTGSVSFMIKTVKTGMIEIKVTGNSPANPDMAIKQLLVTVSEENY